MNKPFSIIYREFKDGLANLINNSNLHPSIIESILQNYLYEISEAAKNQYRIEKAQYEKILSESEKSLEKKDEKKQN